jgi:biotin carboxyl carrier protein
MADIVSNVSGVVMKILVKPGDSVLVDQDILAVESMKMEMMVPSTQKGVVQKIHVAVEDFIQEGQTIVSLS